MDKCHKLCLKYMLFLEIIWSIDACVSRLVCINYWHTSSCSFGFVETYFAQNSADRVASVSYLLISYWKWWTHILTCCEHHQCCRPALSIVPLRVLSTVGRGNHHGPHYLISLNPTPDHHPPLFAQQFACSTSNALICSFNARWLWTSLSPTSNIL